VRGSQTHHTKASPAQRLDEGRHKGRFARPAVDEHHGAAGLSVRLKLVTLHDTGRCCDLLPSRVAQVIARALRQAMMIARAMLGLFRRAENAKGKIAGLSGRQMAKLTLSAYLGAAEQV
jgi:hypothetical protein